MKAILIDAGNTHIRLKKWSGQRASFPAPASGEALQALEPLVEFSTRSFLDRTEDRLAELRQLYSDQDEPALALVSVIPSVTKILSDSWPDLLLADCRSELPFRTLVEDLATVGADRLCNVAAACAAGLEDALIIDAGTATTFDLLIDGVFEGGLIAPGMAFAAQKLGEEAAQLAPVAFEPTRLQPGRTTRQAMAAGAWWTGVGGVEAVISGFLQQHADLAVVLTGGLGKYVQEDARLYDPDWTLRGAAVLAGFDAV